MRKKNGWLLGFFMMIIQQLYGTLGANTRTFSQLASDRGIFTVSFADLLCVERHCLRNKVNGNTRGLSLIMNLTNTRPKHGCANREGASLLSREPVDRGLALAIIHHWAIRSYVPLPHAKITIERAGPLLLNLFGNPIPRLNISSNGELIFFLFRRNPILGNIFI